jgi:mannan endo-1,4-beta-mannosidase
MANVSFPVFLILATLTGSLSLTVAAPSKVLAFLKENSGTRTVVGVHNDQKTGGVNYYTDAVKNITGKYAGLWGGDFSYDANRVGNRWNMIYEAEKQWNNGAIVNLMWHACPPTVSEPCSWDGDIHSKLSNAQWTELTTDGTALNKIWKTRMDAIAKYLQYLSDKGVEVLWRPHHEMNQGNFWWGGRPGATGTRKLYQITHDYLTKTKGLTNLVWTWDIQDLSWDWAEYNPGDTYWDIFALDIYSLGYTDSLYNTMLRIAGDKPIALGEVGRLPTKAELAKQPRWSFVMSWAYLTLEDNSNSQLTDFYAGTNVLTREELPGWPNYTVMTRYDKVAQQRNRAPNLDNHRLEIYTVDGRRNPVPNYRRRTWNRPL